MTKRAKRIWWTVAAVAVAAVAVAVICLGSVEVPGAGAESVAYERYGVWEPDTEALGEAFEVFTVRQPDDYSGPVECSVVRRVEPDSARCSRGVLYVHGYNDYFLQAELADSVAAWGMEFYAVDLRKYGRSLIEGNRRFELRDISEYYADIDTALALMRRAGVRDVVLMGHSTGGLVVSSYVADTAPQSGQPHLRGVILNSPFLDWNLGSLEGVVPAVAWVGSWWKGLNISQGGSTAYAESLLASGRGEWRYRTDWKLPVSPPVEASWIRAIDQAQRKLRRDEPPLHLPVLLMMSARSVEGDTYTEAHSRADAVLDVTDIDLYGRRLSEQVEVVRIDGGLHDLLLSAPPVRAEAYGVMHRWLLQLNLLKNIVRSQK